MKLMRCFQRCILLGHSEAVRRFEWRWLFVGLKMNSRGIFWVSKMQKSKVLGEKGQEAGEQELQAGFVAWLLSAASSNVNACLEGIDCASQSRHDRARSSDCSRLTKVLTSPTAVYLFPVRTKEKKRARRLKFLCRSMALGQCPKGYSIDRSGTSATLSVTICEDLRHCDSGFFLWLSLFPHPS